MSTVFISYSQRDAELADDLTSVLSKLSIDYFQDVRGIGVGEDISTRVREELDNCVVVLVIISPASLKSHWVPYEIGHASALGKVVLPYLTHPDLEVPPYIRELNSATAKQQIANYFAGKFRDDARLTAAVEAKSMYTTQRIASAMEVVLADGKTPMFFTSPDLERVLACNQQIADLLATNRPKLKKESVSWLVSRLIQLVPPDYRPRFAKLQEEIREKFESEEVDYHYADGYVDCNDHPGSNVFHGMWRVRIHAHRVRHMEKPLGFFVYYMLDKVQSIPPFPEEKGDVGEY